MYFKQEHTFLLLEVSTRWREQHIHYIAPLDALLRREEAAPYAANL
jgi:hypothetical protein